MSKYDTAQKPLRTLAVCLGRTGRLTLIGALAEWRQLNHDDARRNAAEVAEAARLSAALESEHPAIPDPAGWAL